MSALSNVVYSHCRSNMYLIAGLCLGFGMSFLFLNVNELVDSPVLMSSHGQESLDEYQPIINIDGKPKQAQKSPKTFIRPRYYSTELGIRGKTFVGVMSSLEFLHSRGVAMNKTVAHLVDKIRFFISIPEGSRPNVSLPGIVGFTDTQDFVGIFHAIKYIIDNYMEDFDYYYIVKDTTYVNARRLMELTNGLSVSQNIHMGDIAGISSYCSLDAGILLSNSVVRKVKSNLDWCVKNIYSESNDINFGRCIVHSSSIPCTNHAQNNKYNTVHLNSSFVFENHLSDVLENHDLVAKSITVYPIFEHGYIYKFNAYFMTIHLTQVQKEISKLRAEIKETTHLGPPESQKPSWPIGNRPPTKAQGRFDILRWTYFNRTHIFLENDFSTVVEMTGSWKMEVDEILDRAVKRMKHDSGQELVFKNLVNGYRKFDASRGVDFILDIAFVTPSKVEVIKRMKICKPLGKVEVLSVPYVTENSRINMVLVVNSLNEAESMKFIEHYAEACMEKKDKTFLLVVLLYNPDSTSKGKEDAFYNIKQQALSLTDKYKKEQMKVAWLSVRLPSPIYFIEFDPMLTVAVADLIAKKFSPESLVLFVETGMELRTDYLNRVRMNTISQTQIFSPVPFTEFHPDIAYADANVQRPELDVNRNYGKYDSYNFNSISFYVKDYMRMRRSNATNIPFVRTDKDLPLILKLGLNHVPTSLFEMFILYGDVHPLRAIEPSLKLRYKPLNCGDRQSNVAFDSCMEQRSSHLGHRGQLAKLILDYQSKL